MGGFFINQELNVIQIYLRLFNTEIILYIINMKIQFGKRTNNNILRVFLVFYFYALFFTAFHHHTSGSIYGSINPNSGSSEFPCNHTEQSGLFHECSFVNEFSNFHQTNPIQPESIRLQIFPSEIIHFQIQITPLHQKNNSPTSPRAPPFS